MLIGLGCVLNGTFRASSYRLLNRFSSTMICNGDVMYCRMEGQLLGFDCLRRSQSVAKGPALCTGQSVAKGLHQGRP